MWITEDDSCLYTYDEDGNMTTRISRIRRIQHDYEYDIENSS